MIPEGADRACFEGLFQALDLNLHQLHLTGYGLSDTTLEEVPANERCSSRLFWSVLCHCAWERQQGRMCWGPCAFSFISQLQLAAGMAFI